VVLGRPAGITLVIREWFFHSIDSSPLPRRRAACDRRRDVLTCRANRARRLKGDRPSSTPSHRRQGLDQRCLQATGTIGAPRGRAQRIDEVDGNRESQAGWPRTGRRDPPAAHADHPPPPPPPDRGARESRRRTRADSPGTDLVLLLHVLTPREGARRARSWRSKRVNKRLARLACLANEAGRCCAREIAAHRGSTERYRARQLLFVGCECIAAPAAAPRPVLLRAVMPDVGEVLIIDEVAARRAPMTPIDFRGYANNPRPSSPRTRKRIAAHEEEQPMPHRYCARLVEALARPSALTPWCQTIPCPQ
jgi:hypothetical protein